MMGRTAMVCLLLMSSIYHTSAFQMGGLVNQIHPFGSATKSLFQPSQSFGRQTQRFRWAPMSVQLFAMSSVAVSNQVSDPFDEVRAKMSKESRQVLLDNVDPSSVGAMDLLLSSLKGKAQLDEALVGFHRQTGGIQTVPCLDEAECKALRDFVDEMSMRWHGPNARANVHWTTRIDSVDKCPDYQINLYPSDLARIVGWKGYTKIFNLPFKIDDPNFESNLEPEDTHLKLGIFLRKYTTDTRPFIPFHVDSNAWTGNIAINADTEYEGGNLIVASSGELKVVERKQGDATIHDNKIAHGVSSMISGTRYSLILFFDRE